MIIDYFNLITVTAAPDAANPPLVVDSNGMLTGAVTLQGLELISGRGS